MTRTLFVREEAKSELREAFAWYQTRRVGLGFEFLRTVRVTLAAIERAPERYPFAFDDIRKAPLPRFRTSCTTSRFPPGLRCSRSFMSVALPNAGRRAADA